MNNLTSRRKFLKVVSLLSLAPLFLYNYNISKIKSIPRNGFLLGAGYPEMNTFPANIIAQATRVF